MNCEYLLQINECNYLFLFVSCELVFCSSRNHCKVSPSNFWIPINCLRMVQLHCKANHFPRMVICLRTVSANLAPTGLKSNSVMSERVKISPMCWAKWNSRRCHGPMTTKDCFIAWVIFRKLNFLLELIRIELIWCYSVIQIRMVKPMVPKPKWTKIRSCTITAWANRKIRMCSWSTFRKIHRGECKYQRWNLIWVCEWRENYLLLL